MEHSVAVQMIQQGVGRTLPARWADLGAGQGVFTHALADLLHPESVVYAVDIDHSALDSITQLERKAAIITMRHDFTEADLSLKDLDGILMANSLHFVKDKIALIRRLRKILKPDASFIIVEYNTRTSSPWVPYPIDFVALQKVMMDAGFNQLTKMEELPSRYNQANLYSALVK